MIALIILFLLLILQPPPSSKDGDISKLGKNWMGASLSAVLAEKCNFEKYTTGCYSGSNLMCDLNTYECICLPDYPILIEGRWCHRRARYNEICKYNQQCDNSNGFYCLYSDNETLVEHLAARLQNLAEYHAKCRCKSKGLRHHITKSSKLNRTSLAATKPHSQKSHSLSGGSYSDEISQEIETCVQPASINQQCDIDIQCDQGTKNSICDESTKRCKCSSQHYYDSKKDACEPQPECRHNDSSDRNSQCYRFNASSRRCEKVSFFCSLPRFIWIFLFICVIAMLIFLLTVRSQYNPSLFTDDRLSITSNSGSIRNGHDHRHQRRHRRIDNCQRSHVNQTTVNGSRNGSINSSLSPAVADLSSCEYDVPPPYEVAINMKS